MKKITSTFVALILILNFAISLPVDAEALVVIIVEYDYGPLMVLDADPTSGEQVGPGMVQIGNNKYEVGYDDFDYQSYINAFINHKNVVCELHNGKAFKLYIPEDIVKVKTDPQKIYYRDGRFDISKFNIDVEVSNSLNIKESFPDKILNKIKSTVTEIELKSMQDGLNFGKTGFGWFENYKTNTSNQYNQDIKFGSTNKFSYTVNINKDYKLSSDNNSFSVQCVVKFANGQDITKNVQILIGNLDYQKQVVQNKRQTSTTRKKVSETRSTLNKIANKSVTYDAKIDAYLTENQRKYLKEFIYVWVADIFAATSSEYAKKDTKVQDKVFERLGIDKNILTTVTSTNATIKMNINTTLGKRTIQFDLKLNNYILGKVSYSGFGTLNYSMYKSSIFGDDTSDMISGTGMVALVDMEAFVGQLKTIANNAIKLGYDSLWGNDANKIADYLTSGTIVEVLKSNGIVKGTFSGNLYDLLKEPTERYIEAEIHCPVDINVYDGDGTLVGAIKDNKIIKNTGELCINIVDDEKYIRMIDDNYMIKLIGNDSGTMDYVVNECDEAGNALKSIHYNNLELSKDLVYNAPIPNANGLSDYMYNLYNCDNKEILPSQVNEFDESSILSCYSSFSVDSLIYSVNSDGTVMVYNCYDSVTSVSIPKYVSYKGYNYKVTSIGNGAFYTCTSLTSITIPNSVTSIGSWAFSGCESLTSITIPNSVTSIGYKAFEGCTSLASITIPNSVTSIGDLAFSGCESLTSITIPNSVTNIGPYAFIGCTNLTSVTIPDSVTSIGAYAFKGCTSLTSVTIPDSVTSIGESAFRECTSLTSVTIGNSVTSIGEYAFYICTSLTSITIPNSVTSIGNGAFYTCTSLTSITVDSNNKYYSSKDGVLFNKDKATLIQYPIGNKRTSYTIPNSVTSIGNWAFDEDCTSLTSVTIPDSVTYIGYNAFVGCTSLKSVTIPKSVESIGYRALGYTFDSKSNEHIKINGFKIKCYAGTAGEKYAKDNGLNYTLLDCSAHTHSYTSKVTKAATCTANGVKTFTCTKCGNSYTQVIKAIGHKYKNTVVKPTYFAQGYTEHKCSVCGDSYKDTITAVKKVPVISGAKATGTTYNSIKLSWNKTSGVDGYIVYRYNSARKSWIRLAKISNSNTTSYTATGLSSAAEYQIAVKGYATENGKEIGSPKLSLIKATTNPGVVSNFKASGYTTNSVKLTWNKVNGAEGYVVYRYNPSTKGWIRLAKIKGTSYTATGLASGTSYKFAVKSYITLNGKEFGGSQLTQVFTSTTPDKVNFAVKSPSAGRATLSWSKVRGATGYIVYYKENAKDSWHRLTVTSGTSYTKTGLKRGNNYIFTVKAYKTTGSVTYNGAFTAKTLKIK